MKIEVEGRSFKGYINKIISDEFNQCTDEFKSVLEKLPCKIEVYLTRDVVELWNDHINIPGYGRLTKRKLMENFNNYMNEAGNSIMHASYTGYRSKDNKFHISSLKLHVNTNAVNDLIVRHIDKLDRIIEYIKQSARHEFGHIIDYIGYDGMDINEYDMDVERIEAEKAAYYESIKAKGYTTAEDLRRYYQLEREARANNNVGITLEETIALNESFIVDHDKLKTTYNIEITYEDLPEEK